MSPCCLWSNSFRQMHFEKQCRLGDFCKHSLMYNAGTCGVCRRQLLEDTAAVTIPPRIVSTAHAYLLRLLQALCVHVCMCRWGWVHLWSCYGRLCAFPCGPGLPFKVSVPPIDRCVQEAFIAPGSACSHECVPRWSIELTRSYIDVWVVFFNFQIVTPIYCSNHLKNEIS